MSMTERDQTLTGSEVRGSATTDVHLSVSVSRPAQRRWRETKPFYRTSEFLVLVAAVAAVIGFGYSGDDSLNTFRTWLLVTVLASTYIVSRGLAKAGSHADWDDDGHRGDHAAH